MNVPSGSLVVPIPKCARALAATPPACPPCEADTRILELADELGKGHGKPEAMIRYERELASGLSDIVIILQRPYVKNYGASFHKIVENSPTLNWLDATMRLQARTATPKTTLEFRLYPVSS